MTLPKTVCGASPDHTHFIAIIMLSTEDSINFEEYT